MVKRPEILEELRRWTEWYSPHTIRQYFKHVRDFLDYIGDKDWRDRDVLYGYTQHLKQRGLSQTHINYIIRGPIGALFRAYNLHIPIKLPRARVGQAVVDFTERVSFIGEEVIRLINAAMKTGNNQIKAILAISTIYGPRASEIQQMSKDDIHPKKKTLVIHTLKYGFKREHLIPPILQPILFTYDFPSISGNFIGDILKTVAYAAGVDTRPRKSYHAIRHALINEMKYTCGFSNDVISKFTGWRESGMTGQYVRPFPFQPEIDKQVFANHPFLPLWEK